ncbi:MAG TPA: hypothetical protein VFO10_18360 [Oligoflexus sp.]|uniref:hypothetical protein n=1 Tax=Oligoflexus sp. TaxID=1971216 RepID=UPI002D7F8A55|nr:hypothetical protein [Oligoflexus sp.]HET9239230.1 hypothetical protein [Oligoflexus sp.]
METEKMKDQELMTFMNAVAPDQNGSQVPLSIVKDLVISKARIGMVYLVGSIAGYFLTLVVCAQCSIGLSPLAWKTAGLIQSMPDPWCALICGSIFGVSPFVASLVLLTRFQHRFLLFRMTWIPILVPAIACAILTVFGAGHDWSWHGYWMLAAVLTPYLLEMFAGTVLKQARWRPNPA